VLGMGLGSDVVVALTKAAAAGWVKSYSCEIDRSHDSFEIDRSRVQFEIDRSQSAIEIDRSQKSADYGKQKWDCLRG